MSYESVNWLILAVVGEVAHGWLDMIMVVDYGKKQ